MNSREVLLSRVRAAIGSDSAPADDVIDRGYRQRDEDSPAEITTRFAERVAEYRATVRRIGSHELPDAIAEACRGRGLQSLVLPGDVPREWIPAGVKIMRDAPDRPLSNEQLDGSGGVLTGCAVGIAQTGTIVLDGGERQGRRAITLLPDYHLCVVYEDQVVGLVPEGIALLGDTMRHTAAPITFISGPSATSDIELSRVEGVHGPRTLEVLLVAGGGGAGRCPPERAPGHRQWFIPDCYLPEDTPDKGDFISHESCCILNAGGSEARCVLTLYFEDREPVRTIEVTVGAERCWHVRFDRLETIAGVRIPRDVPYGLGIVSDQNVIVQHSRLDSRKDGLAYMTVMGYAED